MTLNRFARCLTLAVLTVGLTAPGVGAVRTQIRLPSLPAEVPKIGRLPSLNELLGRDPITSNLNDAVTEVPFLDRFDPKTASPLLELPLGLDEGVTLVPGLWEGDLQSYCLKAGTHRPRSGDGYAWAPLNGSKAEVVTAILNRSPQYRDIPQQDIQLLLWGILAKTKVSDLPEGPRRAADQLLTPSQIASIDGSALDVIPEDALARITRPVADSARRVLEAENRIRETFADPAGASYQEIERLAVLDGVPVREPGSRDVPAGRWSFHPAGYFLRYAPRDYTDTKIQLYAPEAFAADRDAQGRLAELRDPYGAVLRVEYGGAGIGEMAFTPAGGAAMTVQVRRDARADAATRDAVAGASRLVPSDRRQSPRGRDVAEVTQLIVSISDPQALDFLHRAWASAVADWATAAVASRGVDRQEPRYRLIAFAAFQSGGGWGGHGGGGFGAGGGAGMPSGSGQRIGGSLRESHKIPNAADKARTAVGYGKSAIGKGMGRAGPGLSIPIALFGKILDFNFDTWAAASKALAGDPPRADFREFMRPSIPAVQTRLQAGPGITAPQADRMNALVRDLTAANAYLRAAIVAMDRHGGAVQAGDRLWAARQAQALIYLKREAGGLALKIAEDLKALQPDINGQLTITAADVLAGRQLMEQGWTDEDRKAAAAAGLSDAELEIVKAARLALPPLDRSMSSDEALQEMIDAVRALGERWSALPAVAAPWTGSQARLIASR